MKYPTTTLLLALLFLSSCSSELDRCIEANSGNLENNIREKFQKFFDEYSGEDGKVSVSGDTYDDYLNNVLTDFEKEITKCSNDKLATYMEENNIDFSEGDEYKDKSEEIWVSCEKSMSLERVERATKICNAQGIY